MADHEGFSVDQLQDVRAPSHDGRTFTLRRRSRAWRLMGLDERQCSAFVDELQARLADALETFAARTDAELIEVHPARAGGTWIYGVFSQDGHAELRATLVARPEEISTSYTQPRNPDAHDEIRSLHEEFTKLTQYRFEDLQPCGRRRLLRVKVHDGERWFMRYPLPMFVQMALGVFARHGACQWIVTQRSFGEATALQDESERIFQHTGGFIRSSWVLINTYEAHANAVDSERLQEALDIVLLLLRCMQEVPLEDGVASLRWQLNPSPQEVLDGLLDPATRFLLANFEARGGAWTTGDRTSGASHDSQADAQPAGVVDLASLRGRLHHVLLLRVFHCHAFHSPFKEEQDPVDGRTIGHALLETGAAFVEGGITEESLMDCYCMLLQTLLGRSDFRLLVRSRSFDGSFDYHATMENVNRILVDAGHEALAQTL